MIIIRVMGFLLLALSGTMLFALPFSIYYGGEDAIAILLSAAITAITGIISFIGGRSRRKEDIRPKEAYAIVALGWVLLSAFGMLPFLISGAIPSVTDAYFETASGFTTTGATILEDIEILPHGLLFWRSFTHWLGGMGIILLSVAILPFLGVGGMQLFKAEVPGPMTDRLKPRITETAKILWGVYVLISAIETVLLLAGGMNFFESLCHTFGTMATGGFSTKNASIGAYGSAYIEYVIIIFMLIAGTSFSLHYNLLRGNWKAYWRSQEFRFYLLLIIISFVLIFIDVVQRNGFEIELSVRQVLFQVSAIITTTGYGTADYEQWSVSSQLILFFLMFVGGCAGSTGGGMKVMRIYLLVQFARSEIVRLLHPQAVVPIKIGKTVVERSVILNILGFFVIYLMITTLGVLAMSMFGLDIATSFGSVAATINNIGPGLGSVGPTDNYAFMPDGAKWLLSALMLIGRLEVFTIIILLAPSFWKK